MSYEVGGNEYLKYSLNFSWLVCLLISILIWKVDLTAYVEKHEFCFDAVLDEHVTNDEVGICSYGNIWKSHLIFLFFSMWKMCQHVLFDLSLSNITEKLLYVPPFSFLFPPYLWSGTCLLMCWFCFNFLFLCFQKILLDCTVSQCLNAHLSLEGVSCHCGTNYSNHFSAHKGNMLCIWSDW